MKIELNHIYNGDCLALFKEMRDNSVDLIVTDPPYRDLMRALILNSTRPHQIVLDPCLGSGTTAIAAIREKRCYIGFELDEKYFDTAEKRILAESQKKSLFDFAE